MDEKQSQLEWEARVGRLAALAAWLAAALILATFAYRIAGLPRGADNAKEFLPKVHAHESAFIVSGVLVGIAMLAFIPPLLYLYRVTRFRRPELPAVTRYLVVAGPVLYAICSIWLQARYLHAADQFVAGEVKTNKHAEHLISSATAAPAGLSLAASIAIGLSTILISLNAMRAGLLSRFMGVLGVILGALFVLPLIASPIIQLFWLLALGALLMDRWPGGRGPAWETGEPAPWPTAQDRLGAPGADGSGDEDDEEPEAEPEPERAVTPRSSRKRRKRKARR
ncbi:MAG TPA: DUF4386 family protein [Thermoleophilaceae bacterium]|nr:DUF4386 family protein [Thermoleophilaceae bacterium]